MYVEFGHGRAVLLPMLLLCMITDILRPNPYQHQDCHLEVVESLILESKIARFL